MISGTDLYEELARSWLRLGGARTRRVNYEGGVIHALEIDGGGELPPVALLHGFSASGPQQYPGLIRLLRPHVRRLWLPDLPGHGKSTVPLRLDGRSLQRGLDAALDELLDEPAVVFGSSLSGGLALRYATARPDALLGLVLCSPSGAPSTREEVAALQELFEVSSHRKALAFVDSLFPRPSPLRHAYAWGVRQQFDRPHLAALLRQLERGDFLRPDELRRLSVPTLLIWGGAERVLPPTHLAFFRRHLPCGTEIVRPPEFGHAPFLHRSRDLADILLRFSAEARDASRYSREIADQPLVAEE